MRFEQPVGERKKQWDEFVQLHHGEIFSSSVYLDAAAENWEILWNEDSSGGMVCPYTLKLGIRTLYAPFSHRYVQWIGEGEPDPEDLLAVLKSRYRSAAAHFLSKKHYLFATRVFQEVQEESFRPNQQAKRMLKKAVDFSIVEQFDPGKLLDLVRDELTGRVVEIHDVSIGKLDKIVQNFGSSSLLQFNLMLENQWCGGIWILPFGNRVLYLKGTVTKEAKESGGMYKLMNHAIQFSFSHHAVFDFGGSNAEGVRRFNMNWGAKDVSYYYFRWNSAPFWWKALQKVKHLWKK